MSLKEACLLNTCKTSACAQQSAVSGSSQVFLLLVLCQILPDSDLGSLSAERLRFDSLKDQRLIICPPAQGWHQGPLMLYTYWFWVFYPWWYNLLIAQPTSLLRLISGAPAMYLTTLPKAVLHFCACFAVLYPREMRSASPRVGDWVTPVSPYIR